MMAHATMIAQSTDETWSSSRPEVTEDGLRYRAVDSARPKTRWSQISLPSTPTFFDNRPWSTRRHMSLEVIDLRLGQAKPSRSYPRPATESLWGLSVERPSLVNWE